MRVLSLPPMDLANARLSGWGASATNWIITWSREGKKGNFTLNRSAVGMFGKRVGICAQIQRNSLTGTSTEAAEAIGTPSMQARVVSVPSGSAVYACHESQPL